MKKRLKQFQQSDFDIIILRLTVIIIITFYGILKWFDFEVDALKPIISGSWLRFLYDLFGFHGTSYLLGIIEGVTYIALMVGGIKPKIGIVGALLTMLIAVVTLSTLPQLGLNGFIFKDILLLGAGIVLLKYDLNRVSDNRVQS